MQAACHGGPFAQCVAPEILLAEIKHLLIEGFDDQLLVIPDAVADVRIVRLGGGDFCPWNRMGAYFPSDDSDYVSETNSRCGSISHGHFVNWPLPRIHYAVLFVLDRAGHWFGHHRMCSDLPNVLRGRDPLHRDRYPATTVCLPTRV